MIGLKKGTVKLIPHETEWEAEAQRTVARLQAILGPVIRDIQHVGSTAIPAIKAKPIIDIAVAVEDFADVLAREKEMNDFGFYYRPNAGLEEQILFASGSYYEGTGDIQTHFIHIVPVGSKSWKHYIHFRDYMNSHPEAAKAYEDLKVSLEAKTQHDPGRERYLQGKHDFILSILQLADEN